MTFGAWEWRQYTGVAVGEEPSLPPDIDAILNAACPFLLDGESTPQRVKDNHVLVLIPARVNGEPFTLNKLGALIKAKAFPQNEDEHGYAYYSDEVREEVCNRPLSQVPYWILLTRRVMEGSLGQRLSVHEAMPKRHRGYSMPHVFEAATAILTHYIRSGQRLYGNAPWRSTRCRETVDDNEYSVFVGGSSLGFSVHDHYFGNFRYGVSCCRKL